MTQVNQEAVDYYLWRDAFKQARYNAIEESNSLQKQYFGEHADGSLVTEEEEEQRLGLRNERDWAVHREETHNYNLAEEFNNAPSSPLYDPKINSTEAAAPSSPDYSPSPIDEREDELAKTLAYPPAPYDPNNNNAPAMDDDANVVMMDGLPYTLRQIHWWKKCYDDHRKHCCTPMEVYLWRECPNPNCHAMIAPIIQLV